MGMTEAQARDVQERICRDEPCVCGEEFVDGVLNHTDECEYNAFLEALVETED